MCFYSKSDEIKQFHDYLGQTHCLCFEGYSGSQCDVIGEIQDFNWALDYENPLDKYVDYDLFIIQTFNFS